MTENIDRPGSDDAQLSALMHVINEITAHKVPKYEMHELTSKSMLQELQHLIYDCNALDDGDTIDTLNRVRIEIKYLCSIINDLRERIKEHETEIIANYYRDLWELREKQDRSRCGDEIPNEQFIRNLIGDEAFKIIRESDGLK